MNSVDILSLALADHIIPVIIFVSVLLAWGRLVNIIKASSELFVKTESSFAQVSRIRGSSRSFPYCSCWSEGRFLTSVEPSTSTFVDFLLRTVILLRVAVVVDLSERSGSDPL